MQNNIQHRITGLLNAYKRNRRWKVLTIILSVAVLCNTFYAMRQAAVAVTDENGDTAQIAEIIENSQYEGGTGNEIDGPSVIQTPIDTSIETGGENETPEDGTETGGQDEQGGAGENSTPVNGEENNTGNTDIVPGTEGGEGNGQEGYIDNEEQNNTEENTYLENEEDLYAEGEEDADGEEEEEDVLGAERDNEWITQEVWVGETKIEVQYQESAFDYPVYLGAKQLTEEDWQFEQVSIAVEQAAFEDTMLSVDDYTIFDIYFVNEAWYEVEPNEGSAVIVSISTTGEETPEALEVQEVLHIDEYLQVEPMHAVVTEESADFVTDSFSYYAVMKANLNATGNRIASAYPTFLRVLDQNDIPVEEARTNSAVNVELGWNISRTSDVSAEGDYFVMTLPEGLEFTEGTGQFKLSEAATVGTTTYQKDTPIAEYEISKKVGNNAQTITVTYLEPAVRLIRAKMLFPAYTVKNDPWGELRFEGVRVTATSSFRPEISIDTQTAQHPYIIRITNAQAQQLTDAKITTFKINDQNGTLSNPIALSREDAVKLEIAWEWSSSTQYLGKGDYIKIWLDEAFSCKDLDTTTVDSRGNVINIQIKTEGTLLYDKDKDEQKDKERQNRAVLTITYLDVMGAYNYSSGKITTSAYLVLQDSYLNQTCEVWAKVIGKDPNQNRFYDYFTKTNYIRVQKGTSIPDGTWRLRSHNLDKNVNYDFAAYGGKSYLTASNTGRIGTDSARLFVVANHGSNNLTPYPFETAGTVDVDFDRNLPYEGEPYYMDAYCISPWKSRPIAGENVTGSNGKTTIDFSKATQYDLISIGEASAIYGGGDPTGTDGEWSAGAAEKLQRVLSVSFPYVSTDEMLRELQAYGGLSRNYSGISADEAVLAVQIALWRVAYDKGSDYNNSYYKFRANTGGSDSTKVNAIATALTNYNPPVGSGSGNDYTFDGEPLLTYGTNSVTITGKITPAPVAEAINGKFSNENGTSSVAVTINRETGTFTATLNNVDVNDKFKVSFSGLVSDPGACQVLYFRNKVTINTPGESTALQDLIAAICGKRNVNFEWTSDSSRGIEIIKKFVDADGNEIAVAELDDKVKVEITIYRYVQGGTKEVWQVVELNKANNFTWSAKGLPLKDAQGRYYRYEAKETDWSPKGAFTPVTTMPPAEQNGSTSVFKFTNREEEEETTRLLIEKQWVGVANTKTLEACMALYALFGNDEELHRVYMDQGTVYKKDQRLADGTRYLAGPYYFEAAAGREEVFIYLSDEEGLKFLVDKLPKTDDLKRPIRYVVREYSAGEYGKPKPLVETDNNGQETVGDFVVTYSTEGGIANMDDETPTVVVSNIIKTGTITVQKRWVNQDGNAWDFVKLDVEVELIVERNGRVLTGTELEAVVGKNVATKVTLKANTTPPWSHTWENLPQSSELKYYIVETPVPGFDGPTGRVEVVKEGEVYQVVELENKRIPTELILVKEDADSHKKLKDAEFDLYRIHRSTKEETWVGKYRTGEDGTVKLDNLWFGFDYKLIETQAPKGYVTNYNEQPYVIFEVDGMGTPGNPHDDVIRIGAHYPNDGFSASLVDENGIGIRYLTVYNKAITYELPEAGGTGTTRYIAGGMSLTMATILMYILLRMFPERQTVNRKSKRTVTMRKNGKRGASKY